MLFRRGVALNCTLNSELADSGLFDRVLIHPASHDSGTALGGCFYVNAKLGRHHPIAFKSACLGPSYSDGLVRKTLESGNLSYEELNESELARRCAEDISKGLIVGWFQGRMEWGPRALGKRIKCKRRKANVGSIESFVNSHQS